VKLLITGCNGQVGTALMLQASAFGYEAVGLDRDDLDITNQVAVFEILKTHQPDAVVNAAAYTAVDKAEADVDAAFAVNATAVGYLARACVALGIPLVHISTDYVFDGSKDGAYSETDAVSPLGVYGETKLAGEALVREICEKYYILRTSWVFSAHGNNFVKTMLRLGAERTELGIVSDQKGKPTSAKEIAVTIYNLLHSAKPSWGTYHVAQPDATTWFGFAEAIFAEARKQGMALKVATLHKLTTADYPTPAKRPANSVLNCSKLETEFERKIKPWAESLSEVISELKVKSKMEDRDEPNE